MLKNTNLNNQNENLEQEEKPKKKRKKQAPTTSLIVENKQVGNATRLMARHNTTVGGSQRNFYEHIGKKIVAGDYKGIIEPPVDDRKRINIDRDLYKQISEVAEEMGYKRKVSELYEKIISYEYSKQVNGRMNEEEKIKNQDDFLNIGSVENATDKLE